MEAIDLQRFEHVRRKQLREFGRMTSDSAAGFIIDLDIALEPAALASVDIKWRGGDDGLFTVVGTFSRPADDVAAGLLVAFDQVSYASGAAATVDVGREVITASFATWAAEIGLATVRITASHHPAGPRGE